MAILARETIVWFAITLYAVAWPGLAAVAACWSDNVNPIQAGAFALVTAVTALKLWSFAIVMWQCRCVCLLSADCAK